MTIALGPWEKYFLHRLGAGGGVGTSVLVELDRPVAVDDLHRALTAVRHSFPVFFSRLAIDPSRPARLTAESEIDGDVAAFLVEADRDTEPRDYFRTVLSRPLDPFSTGLFRLHLGRGSRPFVGFQLSHICGDGRTFVAFRDAFARALDGHPSAMPAPFAIVAPDQLRRRLPSAWPGAPAGFIRRQSPTMSGAADDAMTTPEWRVVRAALPAVAARDFVRRSRAANVSPLAYLAGCLAVAVDRCYDAWHSRPGDYFAVNVPLDVRPWFGLRGRLGNLVYPVGVPLTQHDVSDVDGAARAIADRLAAGQRTFLAFHEISRALAQADEAPIDRATMSFAGDPTVSPSVGAGRGRVDPLEILGVTEFGQRAPFDCLGAARVVDYLFQSPVVVRSPFGNGSQITFTIAWYASLERRLRDFIGTLLGVIATGTALPGAAPAWEIV